MTRMGNLWYGDVKPTVASTKTTMDPNPKLYNYRATIVPDSEENAQTERMDATEAVRWLKEYAETQGVPDLKRAVRAVCEAFGTIL